MTDTPAFAEHSCSIKGRSQTANLQAATKVFSWARAVGGGGGPGKVFAVDGKAEDASLAEGGSEPGCSRCTSPRWF